MLKQAEISNALEKEIQPDNIFMSELWGED